MAHAAGLTRDEIDKLVRAYLDLAAAKREANEAAADVSTEAIKARQTVAKFNKLADMGVVTDAHIDKLNAAGSQAERLGVMEWVISAFERYTGGRVPGFAGGGLVPGIKGSPQLVVAHGGERVVSNESQVEQPDWTEVARHMGREFARVLEHERRAG